MSNYVYKDTVEQGFEKIKLTKEEHMAIFKRKPNRMKKEYFRKSNLYEVHYFTPWWVKVLNIISYPVLVLIHGFGSIKEINSDISDLFHEKERCKFCGDSAYIKEKESI